MRFSPPDTGASSVEYSLIIAAIAAVLIVIVVALGAVISKTLDRLDQGLIQQQTGQQTDQPFDPAPGPDTTTSPSEPGTNLPSISDSIACTSTTSTTSPSDATSSTPARVPCTE